MTGPADPSHRVVVTGGASGIGLAVARAAARRGDRVAILDRDPAAIGRLPPWPDAQVAGHLCDVTDPPSLTDALTRATEQLRGTPTQLIASAGVFPVTPALSIDAAEWRDVMDINVYGAFAPAQRIAQSLVTSGEPGSIVFVSSNAAYIGFDWDPAAHYSASKGALIALTRQLAVEWARHRIRVNCIAPGIVETPLLRLQKESSRTQDYLERSVPLRRLGSADEIARACLFLSGPESSYITGQTLIVDGGAVTA